MTHDVLHRDDGPVSWDLFCRVVDNLGDVGIAWRLARQLVRIDRHAVRLFVDGLDALATIEPRIDGTLRSQSVECIEIRSWPDEAEASAWRPGAVVVEMLGCGLPPACLDAMSAASVDDGGVVAGADGSRATGRGPIWIDYEHLSAEAWVDGFHGLPSPHPRLALVKHFFYPGFGPRTGGLLVEPGIDERRRAFLADPDAVGTLWRRLGVPPPAPGEKRLSLFGYVGAPVAALFDAMADAGTRWSVVVPPGPLADTLFGSSSRPESPRPAGEAGAVARGATPDRTPVVLPIPFTDQDDYDRLLWGCDANVVRGEDSFVRAQIARRPFVWQIYRQPDAAHLAKLLAFEGRFDAGFPPAERAGQRAFWRSWNAPSDDGGDRLAAARWLAAGPVLAASTAAWAEHVLAEPPLVERLMSCVATLGAGPRDAAAATRRA